MTWAALAFAAVVSHGVDARQGQSGSRDARPEGAAPQGTGVIAGTVAAADTGRASGSVRVTLTGGPRAPRPVITDASGHFEFTGLAAGEYTLSASKAGFLDVIYGQRTPGSGRPGTPIHLADGQRLDRLELGLPRGGVITGVVRDEQGEPSYGTQVRVLRFVMRSGVRSLQAAGSSATDDRGIYRVPVLLPGEYLVVATPRNAINIEIQPELEAREAAVAAAAKAKVEWVAVVEGAAFQSGASTLAPVYFPGTTDGRAAMPVTVAIGEERTAVDLQLQSVPTVTVTGTLLSDEPVPPGAMVFLIDQGLPYSGVGVRSARTTQGGGFKFENVAPGQYLLSARALPPRPLPVLADMTGDARQQELVLTRLKVLEAQVSLQAASAGDARWAQTELSLDGRTPPMVMMPLQDGMSIEGSIAFDGAPPQNLDYRKMRVMLSPLDSASAAFEMAPAPVDAEGRFSFGSVAPGTYRVTAVGAPSGWIARSAMLAGQDVFDTPLVVRAGQNLTGGVVTFSSRISELSGTLQDPSGQPVPEYTIVVFPVEERFWTPLSRRVQATRPSTSGHFSISGLPAGNYRIAAIVDAEPGQWYDPAFLRQIAGAGVPFTLADGETKTQNLSVQQPAPRRPWPR